MSRILKVVAVLAVIGGVGYAVVANLETDPVASDEPAAIILRAPEGFVVEASDATSLAEAAVELLRVPGMSSGVEFSETGDRVILLVDRGGQRVVEMRASRSGTIVERTWVGDVDRRLKWASTNGDLDVPGMQPSTGKNLYH
jgi:hypothetical protein